MNHYKLIARSYNFLYLDIKGNLVSIQLQHSESFIGNTFYDLPYVKNEEEASLLLNLQNELKNQCVEF